MTTKSPSQPKLRVASTVAGEDLAYGDYVAALSETVEVPSFMWDGCGTSLSPDEMVPLKIIPCDAGQPLKVVAICLPFVYAQTAAGEIETIDTRRIQLARLDSKCAKAVWKQLRSKQKRKKR